MNPLNWFQPKNQLNSPAAVRMTWAKSHVGRSISRTIVLLRKQLWIFPILAILVLGSIVFGVRKAIEFTMKETLRSELQTLLNVETEMVMTWFKVQQTIVESQANDIQVRELIYQLIDEADPVAGKAVDQTALHQKLRKKLAATMTSHDYVGYFVADKSRRILASSADELVGRSDIPEYEAIITRALEGKASVAPPFPSVIMLKDESGQLRTGVPSMFVCAPVRDAGFQIVGVLAFRIRPEREFTRLLQLGRTGQTGETYALDKTGRMISNSRFDETLILLGLLPDQPNIKSILNLSLRDPQGDMAQGFRPKVRRSELPLTKMAADCTSGHSGSNVNGYRDYRGVRVIGAWKWFPDYELGIATEIEAAEAFRPLSILQWTFWGLFALLGLSSLVIFIFSVITGQLRRQAQKAVIESQKLGQYTLEKKLGSGGMGVVYKGIHALLRRPTAIKMLNVDKVNDSSIERFEREVQITCQLNHPNTVAIYDYGRTPEGVFYYAMEYLDGIDLQVLIEKYGPQPESRVIRILMQICGSLYEAHSLGLVHRDIKPANLMLNRRGGEPDVIKVLDFGLVKAIDDQRQSNLTNVNSLTGTPLYMSPEAIQSPNTVDARSDLYALGAVGYFLLTGQPVFEAQNLVELCQHHVDKLPEPPSKRLGQPISAELESLLHACLEKSRAKRPQTAREIVVLLERCPAANDWMIEDADAWWGRHERGEAMSATPTSSTATRTATPVPSSLDRTIITDGN